MNAWKEIAARFADTAEGLSFHREALRFLNTLPSHKPVLAACSGGADSVFLVLVLLGLFEGAPGRLHVLHFNHRLRDRASDEDEAFVARLAEELGLPFHSGTAKSPVPDDEHNLRGVRYDWMEGIYTRLGAGALCLGHHADDLIETQLMALFSGSGPAGLAAPLPVKHFSDGKVRVRPLLSIKRRQIEKDLRSVSAPWREDESNNDASYTRNWIRHQIVPNLLAGIPQDIYSASAHTQTLMRESMDALDHIINELSPEIDNPQKLDLKPFGKQPRALVRRAIMAWWMRFHPEQRLEAGILDGLLNGFEKGKGKTSFSIGEQTVLCLDSDGLLQLLPEQPSPPAHWPAGAEWSWRSGPLFLPDGAFLSARVIERSGGQVPAYQSADPGSEAWIAKWDERIHVRQWKSGDKYRPLGAPGRRKLQDLFTDAKLTAEQKAALPVLINRRNEILWVPGFPPCEDLRIQPEFKTALKLTYQRH